MRRISRLSSLLILPVLTLPTFGQGGAKNLILVPASGPLAGKQIYANSHALLIGVNEYPKLPKDKWLQYALNDVKDVREVLIKSYGFPASNITVLTNSQATKAGVQTALAKYADPSKVGPDDRVLVYFSGHGQTVKIPTTGGEHGFLIPSDAEVDLTNSDNVGPYLATCIKMSDIWGMADALPAKHVLFIADACYSGLMTRGRGGTEKLSDALLHKLAAKTARQVITAGGAGEESFEDPKYGHGMFTQKLLEELKARATKPGDAFIAQDLYTTVKVAVGNLTNAKQNPQMADFQTEGQFLFITTNAGPAQSLPLAQPITSPTAVKSEPKSSKVRTVVWDVDVRGISGLPTGFDDTLTGIFSSDLARLVNPNKISIIEKKNLELINQQQGLSGSSGEKMPGADIIVSTAVRDFKLTEAKVGGTKLPFGIKAPKGLEAVTKRDAMVLIEVRAVNAKTGEEVSKFNVEGRDSVTGVDINFLELLGSFKFDSKSFSSNPLGKALKVALNKAVEQLAKEVDKAKI